MIARTAFGELFVWGDKSGDVTKINVYENSVLPSNIPSEALSKQKKETYFGIFISNIDKKYVDAYDKNEKLLFKKALKKLGVLHMMKCMLLFQR